MKGMNAGGYISASFLDWEAHISAVIFISSCNFRCPWCHNSDLVFSRTEPIEIRSILDDIKRRKMFLDGVVVSGGEPTMSPHLIPLLQEIKAIGLPVKLDTNGSFPTVLEDILRAKLVDYVAMDVKSPLNVDDLRKVTGVEVSPKDLKRSIELIKKMSPQYEFRTTYIPGLFKAEKLFEMQKEIDDDEHWVIQCFKPKDCIDKEYLKLQEVKREDIRKILKNVKIRG